MVTGCRICVELAGCNRGETMEIFVYREGAEKVETGFTAGQLPDLLKEDKTVTWVDMHEPTERTNASCSIFFTSIR
jgi:hypothetical protein